MATPQAASACAACKSKKRRCDKALPQCELCARTGDTCTYHIDPSHMQPTPTASNGTPHTQGVSPHEHNGTPISPQSAPTLQPARSATSFPSALLLDPDCFVTMNLQLPRPALEIPMGTLAILNRGSTAVDTAHSYFQDVHQWFPFISKKRIDLGITLQDGGPDLAMLFLAMKLVLSSFGTDETQQVYMEAKRFLAILQDSGYVSVCYLQAMILVALYEYGHALQPAAWFTVGSCARYVQLLGLCPGRDPSGILNGVASWSEVEERRRVWWAVFILDQAIALPSKRQPSMLEPTADSLLPADDRKWDAGNPLGVVYHSISSPLHIFQSPFARLCQSALFAARTIACQTKQSADTSDATLETMALADEIHSFTVQLENSEDDDLFASHGLAWSALFGLLDKLSCPQGMEHAAGYRPSPQSKSADQLTLQSHAIEILHEASAKILHLAKMTESNRVNPIGFDALYCAAMTYQWLYHESGDEQTHKDLMAARDCISEFGHRWRLCMEYSALERMQADTVRITA